MLPAVRNTVLGLLFAAALCFACSERAETAAGASEAPNRAPQAAPASARATPEPSRQERPLPAFAGRTLDGERVSISSLLGKRLLLFVFNPEVPEAPVAAKAVRGVSGLRGDHNFEIVGVATGSNLGTARTFVADQGLDFPVFDDSNAAIAGTLRLRMPLAILGVDAEGYVIFGRGQFNTEGAQASQAIEAQLRKDLRLPVSGRVTEPILGTRPKAPLFEGGLLDSDETFRLAEQRGRPVVLMFFLYSCSHCHHALESFKELYAALPADKRPVFVGVEVSGRTHATRQKIHELDLDFMTVIFDPDLRIRNAYGALAGVPDTFVIDGEGTIVARVRGWREQEDPPLMRMRLAKLVGAPVPMLLRAKGYSGSEVCGVCHETEHETWMLTSHASAFDTLVEHGFERDAECASCHVVGFGRDGGFSLEQPAAYLENVGCESCHGRGGPHLSPGFVKNAQYESACLICHDVKHSLGFQYATFRPKISHTGNAHLTQLSLAEKQKLLAERGKARSALLPTTAAYVGSAACASCHPAEYETWSKSAHARAGDTLVEKGEAKNADCLRCHTTGYGLPGGFPTGAALAAHADRAGVGCESCHGPAGDHVEPDQRKIGSILSLGDKCDSCVILQICGSCHDDANDPGFEFEVLEKIEAQRHGTIEPGTGKPMGATARVHPRLDSDRSAVAELFRLLDETS